MELYHREMWLSLAFFFAFEVLVDLYALPWYEPSHTNFFCARKFALIAEQEYLTP